MSTPSLPFRFVYQNENGVTTKRELISLTESDDYIKGIQRLDDGIRTFRKSQIQEILNTDEAWNNCPYPEAKPQERRQKNSPDEIKPEIAFTGYAAAKRTEFENLSTEYGMQVRKDVTQNLGYLCVGPNAGAKKIQKALDMGITILEESEFLWFIDTGEILIKEKGLSS